VGLRRLAPALGIALVLAACATISPAPPPEFPDEVRRLVALLTLRRDQIADVRTRAALTVHRGGGVQQLSGVVLVKPPTSLRFEALSPFGQPFILGTVSDGTVTIYNVADNRALIGPATAGAARRWLGIALGAEDLVGVLLGRIGPPPDLREASLVPPDAEGSSLLLVARRQRRRVWLDPETGVISKLEIGQAPDPLVVAYDWPAGGELPQRIQVASPGLEAELRYQDPIVSAGVDPARFTLPVPETAEIRRFY
jgi:outer membrane lipoprotein-sorting protein